MIGFDDYAEYTAQIGRVISWLGRGYMTRVRCSTSYGTFVVTRTGRRWKSTQG